MRSSELCWVSQELAVGDSSESSHIRNTKLKDFLENLLLCCKFQEIKNILMTLRKIKKSIYQLMVTDLQYQHNQDIL